MAVRAALERRIARAMSGLSTSASMPRALGIFPGLRATAPNPPPHFGAGAFNVVVTSRTLGEQ